MGGLMNTDDDYRNKVRDAILDAIVETSMVKGPDGREIAMLRTAEVLDGLTWVMAAILATSSQAATPDGLSGCCKRMAKRLQSITRHLQREGVKSFFDVQPPALH
jgi:hypothetical protein